jgi:hypothetical protein
MARTTKTKTPVDLGPTKIYLPQGPKPGSLFHPRSYQEQVFVAFQNGIRRFVLVWPRRHGKDLTSIALTQKGMLRRPGTYLHVLPDKVRGRSIIWDGADDEGIPFRDRWPKRLMLPNPNGTDGLAVNDAEMVIEFGPFPGHDPHARSRWVVTGADDPNRLAGQNPMGVIFSEYQLMDPAVWTKIVQPMLAANGGWVAFVFTPEGENHAYDLLKTAEPDPKWFTSHLTVETTKRDARGEDGSPVILLQPDPQYPLRDSIAEMRASGTPEEDIQSQYFTSFKGSIRGAIFGDLIGQLEADKRIEFVPYEVSLPVGTAWDIGRDTTAILFWQEIGQAVHLIDYVEEAGKDLAYFCHLLTERRVYRYGEHLFPHDMAVKEWTATETRIAQAQKLLRAPCHVAEKLSVDDSIHASRQLFRRLRVDAVKCKDWITAARSWKYQWDAKKEVYTKEPVHDWASHGAAAYRTLATTYRSGRMMQGQEQPKFTHAHMEFNLFHHARPRPLEQAQTDFNLFSMR